MTRLLVEGTIDFEQFRYMLKAFTQLAKKKFSLISISDAMGGIITIWTVYYINGPFRFVAMTVLKNICAITEYSTEKDCVIMRTN